MYKHVWWINNIKHSYTPIVRPQHQITPKSDSSKRGRGGVVDNTQLKTGGHWSYTEQTPINELELLAGFLKFTLINWFYTRINF
jgi:hypothetical protein